MTNPGHVDPGYEGPLHCTVINMGRETFSLSRGDRIMRVLFFDLDNAAQVNPGAPLAPIADPISPELLARLSVDFLDVERRAQSIADGAVRASTIRASLIGGLIPIGVALLGLLGTAFYSPLQSIRDDITKLRSDLTASATKVEEKDDIHKIDTELATMKVKFDRQVQLEDRLKALESKLNALTGGAQ
jgi:hypothetical protein